MKDIKLIKEVSQFEFVYSVNVKTHTDNQFRLRVQFEFRVKDGKLKSSRVGFLPSGRLIAGRSHTVALYHKAVRKLEKVILGVIPNAKRIVEEPFLTFDLRNTGYSSPYVIEYDPLHLKSGIAFPHPDGDPQCLLEQIKSEVETMFPSQ
jgi:hypothetical protein